MTEDLGLFAATAVLAAVTPQVSLLESSRPICVMAKNTIAARIEPQNRSEPRSLARSRQQGVMRFLSMQVNDPTIEP